PIGIQDFEELRTNDYLYVDKTQHIERLLRGKYYFLSRPRRFGKSLLLSTLRELFLGKKELFKGLWIEDKIDWQPYPVIHLSFGKSDFKEIGVVQAITSRLEDVAQQYRVQLRGSDMANQFESLIEALAQEGQVVILIDEYDKPIIEYLGKEEIPQALKNRDLLKSFYSVLKDLDRQIRLLFITGVSKFSKVSIFSDLNNLADISMHPAYATLAGYTQAELEHYFVDYFSEIVRKQKVAREALLRDVQAWYDGYDFVGESPEKLYNPFSVLNYMDSGKLSNYWFSTGTPTFLTKQLKAQQIYDIKNVIADESSLGKSEIENLDIITLLFQTGYLTLQEKIEHDVFTLGYPNQEVRNSMFRFLLAEYAYDNTRESSAVVVKLKMAFGQNDLEAVFQCLNALLAKIPYDIFEDHLESYYQSVIFLTFSLLGYYTQAEVHTSKGRIDAVVETADHIFILEFKVNDTAAKALAQIKDRQYYQKYLDQGKPIYLIGVACHQKALNEYLVEELAA
ncbi:MAG: ATP-binding protein, partial [Bacteroidia bacterium]|nr:ATP-binding protein [Bacteroidia bacterium]